MDCYLLVTSDLLSSLAHEENVRQKECLHVLNRWPLSVVPPTQTSSTLETPIPAGWGAVSERQTSPPYVQVEFQSYTRASLVAQTVKNLPTTRETWLQSLGWENPLEKGMATHSSILAWRIPWTEAPGGLQSTGSQRVGHDCVMPLSLFHQCWNPSRPQWFCEQGFPLGVSLGGKTEHLAYLSDTLFYTQHSSMTAQYSPSHTLFAFPLHHNPCFCSCFLD